MVYLVNGVVYSQHNIHYNGEKQPERDIVDERMCVYVCVCVLVFVCPVCVCVNPYYYLSYNISFNHSIKSKDRSRTN